MHPALRQGSRSQSGPRRAYRDRLLRILQQVYPIESRHPKVADDGIEVLPPKELEALFRRGSGFNFYVPITALQGFRDSLQEYGIVIYDKHYVHTDGV